MLDEGYTNGDPKMRLGQLQDALLRDARYIVGIEMHTGKRTFDQGVEFFEKEGYQTHETAVRETKRGTSDPTYLYYTLGKLQILKLREDYRKKKGAAVFAGGVPRQLHEAGIPAHQDRAQGAAGRRFADALMTVLAVTSITNILLASLVFFLAGRMSRIPKARFSAAWYFTGVLLLLGVARTDRSRRPRFLRAGRICRAISSSAPIGSHWAALLFAC